MLLLIFSITAKNPSQITLMTKIIAWCVYVRVCGRAIQFVVLDALFFLFKIYSSSCHGPLSWKQKNIILKSMWRLSPGVNDDNTVTLFEHLTASIEYFPS